MTLVILCRQIDISIGSQFSICGVVAGPARQGGPADAAGRAGRACAVGAALGAINGALVAGLGLPSIVVTLATLVIWRESLALVREGEFVQDLPAGFQWFGAGRRRLASGWSCAIALRLVARVRVGPAEPGGRPGGLRDRLGPRGGAAGGHPAAAVVIFAVFVVAGGPGRAGRPAERRPVRRRRSQRRAPGSSSRSSPPSSSAARRSRRTRHARRHAARRRAARLDRPGAGVPRRAAAVGEGDPGADHPRWRSPSMRSTGRGRDVSTAAAGASTASMTPARRGFRTGAQHPARRRWPSKSPSSRSSAPTS